MESSHPQVGQTDNNKPKAAENRDWMRPYKEMTLRALEAGRPGDTEEQAKVSRAYFAELLKKFLAENK